MSSSNTEDFAPSCSKKAQFFISNVTPKSFLTSSVKGFSLLFAVQIGADTQKSHKYFSIKKITSFIFEFASFSLAILSYHKILFLSIGYDNFFKKFLSVLKSNKTVREMRTYFFKN